MAVAIGVIDWLLAWRRKQDHRRSVGSSARYLLRSFNSLVSAHRRYLEGTATPPPDVLDRYESAVEEASQSASRLGSLLDEYEPDIASDLTDYVGRADALLIELKEVKSYVRHATADADEHVAQIRRTGREFVDLTMNLSKRVLRDYKSSLGASEERRP
jgi:hypothetical protein